MALDKGPKSEILGGEGRSPRSKGMATDLFIWTIVILLLIGIAIGCWIGSFYVFGHPEKPISYSLLTRLKKLDPPKRFELTDAPRGQFLNPDKLMEKYGAMTPREMAHANDQLLRDFIRNYKLSPELVTYVVGDFNILDSYELKESDFFPSGVVVIAEAKKNKNVLLEHVFTADAKVVPILHRMLLTGLDLQLNRGLDLSALLNVKRLDDGRIQFTAIPIVYGSYATTSGPGTFSLDPPKTVNVSVGLPVVSTGLVAEATQKLALFKKRTGLSEETTTAEMPTQARPLPQLVRVERPVAVNEANTPPAPTPEPPTSAPTPPPALTPSVLVEATPPPTTPTPSPTAAPPTIASTAGGSWPIYDAGQMPRGRLLGVQDAPDLAERGTSGERIYLQGNFVVTASGTSRAVLRSQAAVAETLGLKGKTSNIRIIAEFPAGAKPPSEGSTFSRDSRRPFQITEVRKSADGQINVYVREVTK
jgi:hypothetical protein